MVSVKKVYCDIENLSRTINDLIKEYTEFRISYISSKQTFIIKAWRTQGKPIG
jgi:hypothetical protein